MLVTLGAGGHATRGQGLLWWPLVVGRPPGWPWEGSLVEAPLRWASARQRNMGSWQEAYAELALDLEAHA